MLNQVPEVPEVILLEILRNEKSGRAAMRRRREDVDESAKEKVEAALRTATERGKWKVAERRGEEVDGAAAIRAFELGRRTGSAPTNSKQLGRSASERQNWIENLFLFQFEVRRTLKTDALQILCLHAKQLSGLFLFSIIYNILVRKF